MLFRRLEFDELQTVIFDEVHYLGDEERGRVWLRLAKFFLLWTKRPCRDFIIGLPKFGVRFIS